MKVGIGIILSVLSSSVLSAVIPNDDSHGPLLVRRAGSLANKDASWSKDNEDQTGPDPSSSGSGTESESGTGIGENTSSASSSSRGLSKMGQLREFAEELRMRFMKNRDPRKQQYILRNNEKSFQTAIKKLAEATEGVSKDQFVVEVKKFLRTALDGARSGSELYDSKVKTPFFVLSITESKNRRSLLKKITKMQNTAKKAVEEHLGAITHAINNIAKHPQNVINEMEKITSSISHMCMALTVVSGRDYKDLVSKVKSPGNEENIEITNNYISKMNDHRDSAFEAVNAIKEEVTKGRVTFKGKTQSRFGAFKTGVKKRLGLKGKSSTDVTSKQEET
ncbi:hypothetical protein BASA50_010536 [Batrachochytrium salamandrivorans]|uniref:Uncharacterized protein n=1 Tax=Batrachochytrium salamandrivorans TaxID=1357716 RepID=A0ABQ8EY94_9FUNG|nr:hypothetical protein BASA50_010536 [Batrachochytrium salamandrivorans]KAH9272588.1 hypothetical protein BASA83_005089 [Batrachochytrium salamandrivorans]